MRLHGNGRFRTWLGHRFGGDRTLGDRIMRRCLHIVGAFVLLYYLLPPIVLGLLPKLYVLLLALGLVLVIEALRVLGRVDLPTIRPRERKRVASFAFFAVALVTAVLVFPKPIAVAVVLGAAIVDPLMGELRHALTLTPAHVAFPLLVYAGLAAVGFRGVGGWSIGATFLACVIAAVSAITVEGVRSPRLDDDLLMTLVPGAILTAIVLTLPWFPNWGA